MHLIVSVTIANDCYQGYSKLDYVLDQQPMYIQWSVNDMCSCHLHFRPSSAVSRICFTVEEMRGFTKNGTRIYIKYPMNGERVAVTVRCLKVLLPVTGYNSIKKGIKNNIHIFLTLPKL